MSMDRDTFLREVDEEVRREQIKKIWEKYGTWIVAGVAVVMAGIGGYQWWQGQRIAAAEAAGTEFEAAMKLAADDKAEDARKAFEAIAAKGPDGYAMLAQLTLAGDAVKAGKPDEALNAYEAIAARTSDPLIKDFARLQAATLKIDSADWTEVKNRLTELTGDKSAWRYQAREMLGVAALRAGKLDEAKEALAPLSADPRTPPAIRERAGAFMSMVVAAELEKTAQAKVELEKTAEPAPDAGGKGADGAGAGEKGAAGSGAPGVKPSAGDGKR
jgi:hypothetical protein